MHSRVYRICAVDRVAARFPADAPLIEYTPVQVARSDLSSVGESVLSVVAEAADVPYPGDQRAGRTEAQQDIQKFAEAALADSKREGFCSPFARAGSRWR